MSISRLTMRASFARVRERIGAMYEKAWMFSPQSEHLFAGAEGGDEPSVTDEYPWPLPAHPLFSPALPFCGSTLYPSEHGALLAAVLGSGEEDERQKPSANGGRAGIGAGRKWGTILP